MDQTYMFSKSLDRDYDKSKDNVDILNDNSGEIAPELISPNREYPHILDIKHHARNLSIIELREVSILKLSEASQEESKALTEHSYLVSEDSSESLTASEIESYVCTPTKTKAGQRFVKSCLFRIQLFVG